jgi:hypothetical protein
MHNIANSTNDTTPELEHVGPSRNEGTPQNGELKLRLDRAAEPKQKEPATYSLRRGWDKWNLSSGGQHSILRHEQGLAYVAWLLTHPNEPIHALDLATRVSAIDGKHNGVTEIIDPATGRVVTVERHSRIQERGLRLDEAMTMKAVLRKQAELEAYVEDEDNTDPQKQEAYQDLLSLYEFETKKGPRVRDDAGRASDAVGRAITRLRKRLSRAVDFDGQPDLVARGFGEYVYKCILVPSGRAGRKGGANRRVKVAWGCFVYESTSVHSLSVPSA